MQTEILNIGDGSRIFQGAPTYFLAIFFAKTAKKWKKLDWEGAHIPSAPSFGSADENVTRHTNTLKQLKEWILLEYPGSQNEPPNVPNILIQFDTLL